MDTESRKLKLEAIQDEPHPRIWTYNDLEDYVVGRIVASFDMVEIEAKERLDKKTGRECIAFWNANRKMISVTRSPEVCKSFGSIRSCSKNSRKVSKHRGIFWLVADSDLRGPTFQEFQIDHNIKF